MNNVLREKIGVGMWWVVVVAMATIFCGLVYAAVQQDMRQGANDPQIQMAEDTAEKLSRGADARSIFSASERVDMRKGLAPFVIVYDGAGSPLDGYGILDGKIPSPPKGVFEYARAHGENRLTWEPVRSVRMAIVVARFSSGNSSGFVLAGRSLREVEKRERQLELEVAAAWIVCMMVIAGGFLVSRIYAPSMSS